MAIEQIDVNAINLGRRLALLNDGTTAPITAMFDILGDETDDPAEARAFTAGPISTGGWLTDAVSNYDFPGSLN